MSTVHGVCGLCREPRELVSSHLLAAGFYRLCRDDTRKNQNPGIIDRGRVVQTSAQIQSPFLCRDCESALNDRGERWTLSRCFRYPTREFPFFEELTSFRRPLLQINDDLVFYSAVDVPNGCKFGYFAASVFWRASAHRWPRYSGIDLGKRYNELFRRFLLRHSPFPRNASLIVVIGRPEAAIADAYLPIGGRHGENWWYEFLIPGMWCHLFIGQSVPQWLHDLSIERSQQMPVAVSNKLYGRAQSNLIEHLRSWGHDPKRELGVTTE